MASAQPIPHKYLSLIHSPHKMISIKQKAACTFLLFKGLSDSFVLRRNIRLLDMVYNVLHTLSPAHIVSFITYKFPAPP